VDYKDATYRFVNAENMKLFKNYPGRYASQYGGYCAFGAAMGPSSMAGIQVSPKKHGFTLRCVAKDYYGGDWMEYVYKVTANKS
jgi:hypothetical protein